MLVHDRSTEHPRGDLGQLLLLVAFLGVWITDSFVLRLGTFPAKAVPSWLRWPLASLLFIAAVFLAYKSHEVLHVTEGGKKLKTDGVFARVRHPMYLSVWLVYLALIILTLSLASLALLAVIVPFYNHIAGYEERILESVFGREYLAYKARVPKWIPRFWPVGRKSRLGVPAQPASPARPRAARRKPGT